MATFEAQVEGLTGLSIDGSSSPTQTELTEFLKDGVKDVTSKIILTNPGDKELFAVKSSIQDSQGFESGRAEILGVMREATADGSSDGSTAWRACRKVSPLLQSRVVDPESLEFASIYNPVYTLEGSGLVSVYPVPDGTNDGYIVYYVNNTPVNGSGSSLAYNHDDIKYFPADKIYLVAIYASIKSLGNALAAKSKADLSLSVSPPVLPVLSDTSITLPTNIPIFAAPDSTISYTNIDTYIDTEEDIELATAKIQEMSLKLQEYQANIQKNLNSFNASNEEYQAGLQKAVQDGQLKSQDDVQKVQKYSSEIQMYSADVQKQVQEWSTNFSKLQADYQWMQGRQQTLFQEYMSAFAGQAPAQQERRR
jgi:hypothetical protein